MHYETYTESDIVISYNIKKYVDHVWEDKWLEEKLVFSVVVVV